MPERNPAAGSMASMDGACGGIFLISKPMSWTAQHPAAPHWPPSPSPTPHWALAPVNARGTGWERVVWPSGWLHTGKGQAILQGGGSRCSGLCPVAERQENAHVCQREKPRASPGPQAPRPHTETRAMGSDKLPLPRCPSAPHSRDKGPFAAPCCLAAVAAGCVGHRSVLAPGLAWLRLEHL